MKKIMFFSDFCRWMNTPVKHEIFVASTTTRGNFEPHRTLSTKQGEPLAEYALAACYADGEGLEKDLVAAYKWSALAAAHGNRESAVFNQSLEKKLSKEQLAVAKKQTQAILKPSVTVTPE